MELLAFAQLAAFALCLPTEALLSKTGGMLDLEFFEGVKPASKRLPVDTELHREIGETLSLANPPTDLFDLLVC